jgi:DNA-binding transcriptional LysR family regulator
VQEKTPRPGPFRVGFVPGVMPGKWERIWRERQLRRLELMTVEVADQEQALRDRRVDMCLVRGEVDGAAFHLIPLYREVPVVVVPVDHPVTAYDEIDVAELDEDLPIMPMSLARLQQRKDLAFRPVTGVEESPVGLAWLRDRDDPDIQAFIGVVRGRTARSSRS